MIFVYIGQFMMLLGISMIIIGVQTQLDKKVDIDSLETASLTFGDEFRDGNGKKVPIIYYIRSSGGEERNSI